MGLVDGNLEKKSAADILSDLISQLKSKFGQDFDTTPASVARKLLEASVALGLAEAQNIHDDILKQSNPISADGLNLDRQLWFIPRKQDARAEGTVTITFSNNETGTLFEVGDVVFLDASDDRYDLLEDIVGDGDTSVDVDVRARKTGPDGNIDADQLTGTEFSDAAVESDWNDKVASFTNSAAFTGGQNKETDTEYVDRARELAASKPDCTLDGIIASVDEVTGVLSVSATENQSDIGGTENKVFENATGGSATTIDGTTTKVAQKLNATNRRFIQHFNFDVTAATSFEGAVTIETDNAGEPSGTLADSELSLDISVSSTGTFSDTFANGAYLASGTDFWLVVERTAGSMDIDGENGSGDNAVQTFGGGAWSSATADNLEAEVVGGIPAHGFRVFVDGGATSDIVSSIFDAKPAGIRDDGKDSDTVTNRAGQTVTVFFERPTIVNVFIEITISKDNTFSGDEDTIRDIITEYIGGTDTASETPGGLGVEEDVIKNEIISRVLDDTFVVGTVDVTDIKLDITDPPTGTTNLSANVGEKFRIGDVSADIDVTLTDV